MVMELDKRDHVPLGRIWFPVIRRWHDPFRPCRGCSGTKEPLFLQVSQLALRHNQRAPVVGGDKSHLHGPCIDGAAEGDSTLAISPL